ncbi:16S RNA G1207 methylase RsmC [Magnetospirillum sp. LM-5]|uniref:class I SAM-dependent methyltransferase n=1 Tax=Magnetospirillum sp. LM-5 TaxID=2681466 RepID=UPI001383FC48|nr:methyltransferase [Magnetospirillum sp. LM-5]CAA7622053.1 16S RNA G1207 methylase RsmC [Magnetospirillum sp. LM-5]
MSDPLIRALLLPFDKGLLAIPQRAFLMRATADDALAGDWRDILVCEQGFKPEFDRLTAAGLKPVARLDGSFPAGLVLLTKHKGENRANIARAWDLLEPGGLLMVCGANAVGAASTQREFEAAFGLDGNLSKHNARTFWCHKADGAAPAILAEWHQGGCPRAVADSGFVARAGGFSPDHVDPGSRLLMDTLPAALAGRVADLGGGWGYLAVELLRRFPAITAIDLFEAETASLEDCATNLAALVPERAACVSARWHDVTGGLPPTDPYDWIVTNPPFHEGAKPDPTIGQAFIKAAWKSIRRRGKLVLVANRHLPYEAELKRLFREVECLTDQAGYKVLLASDRIEARR